MIFLIAGCGGPTEIYNDYNANYKSSDVDDDGNKISRNPLQSTKVEETESEETTEEDFSPVISNPDDLYVYFIDVGNADCNLIMFPDGQNMLIDAGNKADGEDICSYLTFLGVEKIDYLVGTHPHEDHIGGLVDVINTFEIGKVYFPRVPDEYTPSTKIYADVLNAISNKGLSITSPAQGQMIYDQDNITVEFLNSSNGIESDDMNKYSLVIKLTYGEESVIFCGDADEDIEKSILENYDPYYLSCKMLKVGHHGSYTASSDEWLNALSPDYAYIPCGTNNQYGHPHQETLDKLNSHLIEYYRADLDGTVKARISIDNISITTKMTGDISLGDDGWNISMAQK